MVARVSHFTHESEELAVISYPIRRPSAYGALTAAETAVAEGIIAGLSMREVARQRGVSERTVGNQLASIYRKLGVSSRHELISLANQR